MVKGHDFMDGLSICSALYENILKGNLEGSIHSVFNNSFIVQVKDQRLITFLNSKKTMSPNAIKTDNHMSFLDLEFKPKLRINFFRDFALIKALDIEIRYSEAFLWNKNPILNFVKGSRENFITKLNAMGKFLIEKGDQNGIFPLLNILQGKIKGLELFRYNDINSYKREEFILERFLRFIDSYIKEDLDNLSLDAKNIVGYGKGLTPSMDDFLSGIMISRLYLSKYLGVNIEDSYKINKAIIKEIRGLTTLISEDMLIYSSVGEANEDIRRLMISLLGTAPIRRFIEDAENVIRIGETSGTDILLGIHTGVTIMLNCWLSSALPQH